VHEMHVAFFFVAVLVAVQLKGVQCYLAGRGGLHSSQMTRPPQRPRFESVCGSRGISMQLDMAGARDKEVSIQELSNTDDFKRTGAWIAASMGFALAIAATMGPNAGIEFASGYVLEESLSVDNLFVFLLLFDYFKVDKKSEQKVSAYPHPSRLLLAP